MIRKKAATDQAWPSFDRRIAPSATSSDGTRNSASPPSAAGEPGSLQNSRRGDHCQDNGRSLAKTHSPRDTRRKLPAITSVPPVAMHR